MVLYLINKIIRSILMVVLVSLVVFVLSHAVPGGPVVLSGDSRVTEEDAARVKSNLGLDRPIHSQYLSWFKRVFFHFDLGKSYVTGTPVGEMIVSRLPATVELMAAAFCLAFFGAVFLGVLWSRWRQGVLNELLSLVSSAGMSVPVFWLGIMVIALFSVRLGWLPAGGRGEMDEAGTIGDHIRHLVLPASVLALAYFSTWSRYVRAGMMDVSKAEFIVTARAKGLSEGMIVLKHALKNAVIPFVTAVMMQVPTVFSGAVVTETVFSWPGMGRLFYEGLQRHDYPRVMGIVIVSAFLVIIFNAVADVVIRIVDPRIDFRTRGSLPGHGGNAVSVEG